MMLPDALVQDLGWTLLHSLWQGTLVALLLALALRLSRRRSSNLRYLLGCAALVFGLAGPVLTYLVVRTPDGAALEGEPAVVHATEHSLYETIGRLPGAPGASLVPNPTPDAPASLASVRANGIALLRPLLPYLVLGWLVGVVLLSLRLTALYVFTERFKKRHRRPVPQVIRAQLESLCRKLQIRQRVEAFESSLADSPLVIGILKPVILIPTSAITGLDPERLESILVHELAHIRRHDYLVNLLQSVVETLLFYHPAIWWISGRIRREREHACDDLAVEVTGRPLDYAQALTQLESLRRSRLALAASGGNLEARVRRIAGLEERASDTRNGLTGLGLLVCILGFTLAATLPQWVAARSGVVETRPQVWATMIGTEFELDETASALVSLPKRILTGFGRWEPGSLVLEERAGGVRRKMTVTQADDGAFVYAYDVDGAAQPVDDAALAWYRDAFRRSVGYIFATAPAPARLSYRAFERGGVFYSFGHLPSIGFDEIDLDIDSRKGLIRHAGRLLLPSNPEFESVAERNLLNDVGRVTHLAAHDALSGTAEVQDAKVVSFAQDILKHFTPTPTLGLALLELAGELETDAFKAELLTALAPKLPPTDQLAAVFRDVAAGVTDEALRRDVLAVAPTP